MNTTTYHSRPQLKADFLAEIGKHEQADAFLQGTYVSNEPAFKGCAIGCSVRSLYQLQGTLETTERIAYGDHAKVARDLGWPLWLAFLEDNIFERLPVDQAKTWPRRLTEAIPIGAVITDDVLAKILVWSLTAEKFGVIHATDDAEVKGWITTIADYITADAAGTCTADQREAAARAARAARDAWDAWAAWAAWAAWDARDAWDAWAAWAAWDVEISNQFYPALSEYVLSVLRELPIKAVA